jgi:hydrogenase expression/formation protein HypE
MRDPTRGGLATTLKEIAVDSGCGIMIDEKSVPVPPGVKGACELLGLDPLYVANEGILIAIVSPDVAETLVKTMRKHPLGKEACIIGEVRESPSGMVLLRTPIGGTRIVDMLSGDQLPRIC